MRSFATLICLMLALPANAITDDEVRDQIILDSISRYSGACPCPYSVMRNGRKCGGNSAYSKPGGESPVCYRDDVSDADIAQYRAEHG